MWIADPSLSCSFFKFKSTHSKNRTKGARPSLFGVWVLCVLTALFEVSAPDTGGRKCMWQLDKCLACWPLGKEILCVCVCESCTSSTLNIALIQLSTWIENLSTVHVCVYVFVHINNMCTYTWCPSCSVAQHRSINWGSALSWRGVQHEVAAVVLSTSSLLIMLHHSLLVIGFFT